MTTKIPVELSSTPGIVDGSNATAITIDSSENVGIGETSPDRLFHVKKSDSGGTVAKFENSAGTVYLELNTDNQVGGDSGYIGYNSSKDMLFLTDDTERMRILAAGGLTFNGDTAAANALDDYEEGTWTPTIIGSSGTSGQSYSTQVGKYTRIGRFVHMTFDVRLSAKGTISGYVLLGGHGFTFEGSNAGNSLFTTYVSGLLNQDHYPVVGYGSGTLIYLMNPPTDYLGAGDITDSTILLGSIVGKIA